MTRGCKSVYGNIARIGTSPTRRWWASKHQLFLVRAITMVIPGYQLLWQFWYWLNHHKHHSILCSGITVMMFPEHPPFSGWWPNPPSPFIAWPPGWWPMWPAHWTGRSAAWSAWIPSAQGDFPFPPVDVPWEITHRLMRQKIIQKSIEGPFSHGFPMVFPWFSHGSPGRRGRLCTPLESAEPMAPTGALFHPFADFMGWFDGF